MSRKFFKILKFHNYLLSKYKLNSLKFNKDKLDNILSPATKEYLKLEKELQKELNSMNNNKLKHKTR